MHLEKNLTDPVVVAAEQMVDYGGVNEMRPGEAFFNFCMSLPHSKNFVKIEIQMDQKLLRNIRKV